MRLLYFALCFYLCDFLLSTFPFVALIFPPSRKYFSTCRYMGDILGTAPRMFISLKDLIFSLFLFSIYVYGLLNLNVPQWQL